MVQGINGGISIIWNIWLQLLEIVQGRGGGGLSLHPRSIIINRCLAHVHTDQQDGAGWGRMGLQQQDVDLPGLGSEAAT